MGDPHVGACWLSIIIKHMCRLLLVEFRSNMPCSFEVLYMDFPQSREKYIQFQNNANSNYDIKPILVQLQKSAELQLS